MAKLVWDVTSKKYYETGVSNLAIYPVTSNGQYGAGIAWSGIQSINENPSGGDVTSLYADNVKYLNLRGTEEYGANISAYYYPEEFEACDGTAELAEGVKIGQQKRNMFGMAYKTLKGNDVDGTDFGYKLHIVYGCLAKPSGQQHSTVNNSPEAMTFSWEISTTPVPVTGHKPTACVVIDSTKCPEAALNKIEETLFGTEDEEPRILLPDEIVSLLATLN